jgi:N6-adenosine-specific RNA methylase IME4
MQDELRTYNHSKSTQKIIRRIYRENYDVVWVFTDAGNLQYQSTYAARRCVSESYLLSQGGRSRKPDEIFDLVEKCSAAPYLELFARGSRKN